MMRIGKVLSGFSKVKRLHIQAQSTEHGLKATSFTNSDQWLVSNAL